MRASIFCVPVSLPQQNMTVSLFVSLSRLPHVLFFITYSSAYGYAAVLQTAAGGEQFVTRLVVMVEHGRIYCFRFGLNVIFSLQDFIEQGHEFRALTAPKRAALW